MKRPESIRHLALPLLLAAGLACTAPVLANPGITVPMVAAQQQHAALPDAGATGLELGLSPALPGAAMAAAGARDFNDYEQDDMSRFIFALVLWAVIGVSLLFLLGMWLLMMRGLRLYVRETKPSAR